MFKKITICTLLFLHYFMCDAQTRIGLQANFHVSATRLQIDKESGGLGRLYFVQPSLVTDFKINKNFSFRPSIGYLKTGYKNTDLDERVVFHNLNIPLQVCGYMKQTEDNEYTLTLGPVISTAFLGTAEQLSTGNKVDLNFDNIDKLKRATYSIIIDWGVTHKNTWEFKAGFQGMINNLTTRKGTLMRNNVLFIGTTYFISHKNKKTKVAK